MNRDDILRLAGHREVPAWVMKLVMDCIEAEREAGIPIEIDWAGRPSTLVIKDGGTYLRGIDDLERFAELVAAAIRARGEK